MKTENTSIFNKSSGNKAFAIVISVLTALLMAAVGWLWTAKEAQEQAQWSSIKVIHEQVVELRVQVGVLQHLLDHPEQRKEGDNAPDPNEMFKEIEEEMKKKRREPVDEFRHRQEALK